MDEKFLPFEASQGVGKLISSVTKLESHQYWNDQNNNEDTTRIENELGLDGEA